MKLCNVNQTLFLTAPRCLQILFNQPRQRLEVATSASIMQSDENKKVFKTSRIYNILLSSRQRYKCSDVNMNVMQG